MATFNNISGKKFNKLTVTNNYITKIVTKRRRTFWECICDCGNKKFIQINALLSGHTKSCGCLLDGLPPKEAEYNARFRTYQAGAKRRGYNWNLTREQFEILITQNCKWCGSSPEFKKHRETKGKWGALMNGIDRFDNSKGYTLENSVPCCSTCNRLKGDLSMETFLSKIKAIYKLHLESV